MKKSFRVLIILFLLAVVIPTASAGSMSNFKKAQAYTSGQYKDVASSAWYVSGVSSAYELGLMKGTSETSFNPDGNLTVAESLAIACRLHSIYAGNGDTFVQGNPWYQVYVDYAVKNGIMSSGQLNPTNAITREQFAYIMCGALPSTELRAINNVDVVPDVMKNSTYGGFVYRLYAAGVVTGNDQYGTFKPTSNIRRSEVATIITRLAVEDQRKTFVLEKMPEKTGVLSAKEIAQKCSPAVFYIESYAINGSIIGSGSGFFISQDGLAVTNAHVFADVYDAIIMTSDGKTYNDIKLIDLDEDNDVALLRISGNSFPYLTTNANANLVQGEKVYAIGSPRGLDNTFSEGIVSNPNRQLDGIKYIQITVPIAPGSSGGALLNELGEVVGITSGGFAESTGDLNLAIPIKQIDHLNKSSTSHYVYSSETVYPGFSDAIDFGKMSGVNLLKYWETLMGYQLEYDMGDYYDAFGKSAGERFGLSIAYYEELLEGRGFKLTGSTSNAKAFETDDEYICYELDYTNLKITIWVERQYVYYKDVPNLLDLSHTLNMDATSPATIDGSIIYGYKWEKYYSYSAFMNALDEYFDLIDACGYRLINSGFDNGGWYLFEGNGWSILFLVYADSGNVYIDCKPL